MKKTLTSLALIFTLTSCEQTEIETPLYAQPKRKVNAASLGQMNQVNAPQVYNNPAMAPYTVPGASLANVGQQGAGYNAMNVNGQLGPWSYMPPPSNATLPSRALANGNGGGINMGSGGYGGMQQPPVQYGAPQMQGQQFPPVQYSAPPAYGSGNFGANNFGGAPVAMPVMQGQNPQGQNSGYILPPGVTLPPNVGGGSMGNQQMMPPPPQGQSPGRIMMDLQQELEDMNKPVSSNNFSNQQFSQLQPAYFLTPQQNMPKIEIASVGESYELPSLGAEYEDFESKVAQDIQSISDKKTIEEPYSEISENELSELNENELFSFFDNQAEGGQMIDLPSNVPTQPVQLAQPIQQPLQQQQPLAQYVALPVAKPSQVAPAYVQQAYIPNLAAYQNSASVSFQDAQPQQQFNEQQTTVKPISVILSDFTSAPAQQNNNIAYRNETPKSINLKSNSNRNIVTSNQPTSKKYNYINDLNYRSPEASSYDLRNFKSSNIASQNNLRNNGNVRPLLNQPKSLIYKAKGVDGNEKYINQPQQAKRQYAPVTAVRKFESAPQYTNFPTVRYKEDYAPLNAGQNKTFYPKSMTRI